MVGRAQETLDVVELPNNPVAHQLFKNCLKIVVKCIDNVNTLYLDHSDHFSS